MTSAFSEGMTSAMTSSMPTSAATARAVSSLSPVSSTGRRPSALSSAIACRRGRLDGVGDDEHGGRLPVPAGGDRRLAALLGGAPRRVEGSAAARGPSREQRGAAGDQGVAVDDALDAETLAVGEALDGGQRAGRRGRAGDRLGDRVLGGVLERADEAQRLVAVDAVGGEDLDERHLAGGDRAGLVEDDGVDAAGGLEDLRALDQQAQLRAAARCRPSARSGSRGRARRGRR